MTILHLSAVKTWGGGGHQIENLCHELSLTNPEVRNIIVVAEKGKFHDRLAAGSFDYDTVPLAFKADPRAIYKIIKLCKQEKVDLVHIHGSTSLALAVIADRFSSLPPFIFSKKISFPIKKRKQTLYKYNYPKIRKIFCVSEHTRQLIYPDITDKEKLITIYHGTRVDNKSSSTPFLLREKLDIQPQDRIIGNVANHNKGKNLETFIDVADHIVNTRGLKDYRFVQIGSYTEQTPALQEKVRKLKLEKHVFFLGFIDKASNFIPQFDISLITSTNEGMPQVIYESFYHRVPVVSTNIAGIPEVVQHNENGFLADAGDYKKLAQHLIELTKNSHLQDKFTEVSKRKLHENFTTGMMAEKMLNEYQKIINGGS